MKRSGRRAMRASSKNGNIPCWLLEDGFLRSYGTGDRFPPLSIVVDSVGIYYDSTRPSALENLLQSDANVLAADAETYAAAYRAAALCQLRT
jgi:capsular polysaccharide export protein